MPLKQVASCELPKPAFLNAHKKGKTVHLSNLVFAPGWEHILQSHSPLIWTTLHPGENNLKCEQAKMKKVEESFSSFSKTLEQAKLKKK